MSFKIIVKGTASTEYPNPEELNGIECKDCFSTNLEEPSLLLKGISGGFMRFEFDHSDKTLYTITEYEVEEKLITPELEKVRKYTQDQWADGIGEKFSQFPCTIINAEEVFLFPWHYDQVATIKQLKS